MQNQPELLIYARDAAAILQRSIELYDAGVTAFYRVMAVQLRLLLCDTARLHDAPLDLALAPRVFPGLRLPPVGPDGQFDQQTAPLALEAWLEQPLPGPGMTLRRLIRQVCDQDGGAHVDRREPRLPPGQYAGWIRAAAGAVTSALRECIEDERGPA